MKTIQVKIRKGWGGMVPIERIHSDGKQGRKPKYNKNDRTNWRKYEND